MGVAAMGGAWLASQLMRNTVFAGEGGSALPVVPPAKIYRLFAGRTSDAYLTQPTEQIDKFNQYFAGLEKKYGDVQFLGETWCRRRKWRPWPRRSKTPTDC